MDKAVRQKVSWSHLALAFVVGVHLALAPVREVKAAIPVLAAVGVFLKTPLGKSLMTSLAIHASVLAIEFHNTASATPPGTDAEKKLEVKLNPKDPLSTPPGWTAPSGGNPEPTPPGTAAAGSSVPNTTGMTWSSSPAGVSGQASAAAVCSALNASWTVGNQITYSSYACRRADGSSPGFAANAACSGSQIQNVGGQASCGPAIVTCPAGYTASGSTCNLSDAAVVQKPADGKAEIKRVANVFYTDARDTADGLPPGTTVTPDKVEFVDSYGNKWETTIAPDGTSTVKETKPRTDGSGKTDVTTSAMSAPNATTGAVELTGQSVQSFTGTGSLQTATADSGGDGAKETTLQGVKATLDATKTAQDADRTAAEGVASALPGQLSGAAASGQHTVTGLGLPNQSQFGAHDVAGIGAALPSNNGDCVALDVTLPYLGLLTIAPCAVVLAVRPLVDFLTVALGVIGGVFVLLGRREE